MRLDINLRVFIAVCIVAILLLLVLSSIFTPKPEKSGTGAVSSLRNVKSLFDAPAGSVYLMYSKSNPNDYILYERILNMCKNKSQVECYYSLNDLYVDGDGCPRSSVISPGNYMVFIGGPISHPCVNYYERTLQAPCSLEYNSTHIWWKDQNGNVVQKSVTALSEIDEHHDVFIIEFFVDEAGRWVFICYGYGWRGTWIAIEYFSKVIYPNIEDYTNSFYIFKWIDLNEDSFPAINEVFGDPPNFVVVQAMLQSTVNLTVLEWFAETCHSMNLKVTWYVSIYSMEEKVNSLLKLYKEMGDDIELSLGYGAGDTNAFFNKMPPEKRLNYIDYCMGTFKREFGHFPSIIQAYYIDAYTLTYVSKRYPNVKGAIAYCNHEVFLDDFKSAGAYYMPYYPSRFNTLCPAENEEKIDIVVMPYFHRDAGNSILKHSALYNLNPQDGTKVVKNWRKYFQGLFNAFINGWDKFGLAIYAIDLTYNYIPFSEIKEDLAYIKQQVELQKCENVLDKDFLKWFRSRFDETPSYEWRYRSPEDENIVFKWYFTPDSRIGYINGELIDFRKYIHGIYEECFNKAVIPYDNSAIPKNPNE